MPLLHRLKHRSSYGQWLVLAVALLILGGATALNLYVEHGRTQQREQDRLLTQARVIEKNAEQNFAAVHRVLSELSRELPRHMRAKDLSEDIAALTEAMPGVRTALMMDAGGTVVASSRPELLRQNFAYRDYFKTARDNRDADALLVSAPFKTSLGVWGMNLTRTLHDAKGEFAGAIVATLDPEYFKTLMASVLYAPDMWTSITHGDGIQFLMVPERDGQTGKNLAQPGSFFMRHRDSGLDSNVLTGVVYATGEKRMMAMQSIRLQPLKQDKALVVAIGRDLDAIFEPWRRDVRVQGGLFGVVAILAVSALYGFQRGQSKLNRRLEASANALRENERFLSMLTDNIPGMVAYWTADLRCRFSNKAYLEWFGKTREQMRGIRIEDLMGEELFRKNEPYIRAALRGERQQFERTLTKADGSVGYTWAQYLPDAEDGQVRGFYVLVADITALKKTELALAASEWQLKTIIETEPECVKVLAPDCTLLQMNRAGLDMIEADSEDEVRGRSVLDIVVPQYRADFAALNERVCRGESGSLEFEIVGLKGGRRWLDTRAVPMRDAQGCIAGALGVTRDITAAKKAEEELKLAARTDFLTGIANRRHFVATAELELSRTLRYGGEMSILMMDLDHFKQINDARGHRAGDLVLQKFAELGQAGLRDIDLIGRIGGEEFAVLLPQTGLDRALEVAERLRANAAACEVAFEHGLPMRFTVSIGVAALSGRADNVDTLLSRADEALYAAKTAGRNRVSAWRRAAGVLNAAAQA